MKFNLKVKTVEKKDKQKEGKNTKQKEKQEVRRKKTIRIKATKHWISWLQKNKKNDRRYGNTHISKGKVIRRKRSQIVGKCWVP